MNLEPVVVFVVSTLERAGPTNQLLGIVKGVFRHGAKPVVLTLSPEGGRSMKGKFDAEGVEVHSLKLGRFEGMIRGKKRLEKLLNELKPDLIHSQGVRADSLISSISLAVPWVCSARNYPFIDYVMKFGRVKGSLMAIRHISAFKSKAANVVSCSSSIQSQLGSKGVSSRVIHNGVDSILASNCQQPRREKGVLKVGVVGSLIPRKRVDLVINAISILSESESVELYILGDGVLRSSLEAMAGPNCKFFGQVEDVASVVSSLDCFVSASVSEGFPNAVLEALMCGVPCVLSDIEPHKEIYGYYPCGVELFSVAGGAEEIADSVKAVLSSPVNDESKKIISELTFDKFSSEVMSAGYFRLYEELWGRNG